MGNLTKLIAVGAVLYAAYYAYNLYYQSKGVSSLAVQSYSLLKDVSSSWSSSSLKKHIDSRSYAKNRSSYASMLSNVSHLGRFVKCKNLDFGDPTDPKLKGKKIVVGFCEFENGRAQVMHIFEQRDNSYSSYGFRIRIPE